MLKDMLKHSPNQKELNIKKVEKLAHELKKNRIRIEAMRQGIALEHESESTVS